MAKQSGFGVNRNLLLDAIKKETTKEGIDKLFNGMSEGIYHTYPVQIHCLESAMGVSGKIHYDSDKLVDMYASTMEYFLLGTWRGKKKACVYCDKDDAKRNCIQEDDKGFSIRIYLKPSPVLNIRYNSTKKECSTGKIDIYEFRTVPINACPMCQRDLRSN